MTDWDKMIAPEILPPDGINQSWPSGQYGKLNTQPTEWPSQPLTGGTVFGWDLGGDDKTSFVIGKVQSDGKLVIELHEGAEAEAKIKEYNNKVPTHDPYTNPDSHIYYECKCGAVLDPGTKSFAQLNNHASAMGWKVRFGSEHYIPYCVKCGEEVE